MEVHIELTEKELKELVYSYINEKINATVSIDKIKIMVKSKQNYKSEWEEANFKAVYDNFEL
jgi:hypothetical protein